MRDLGPLTGVPLQTLDLSRTAITDLTPLSGAPLRELNLEGCVDLTDLRPLLTMRQLESAVIPLQCKDIEYLRGHPSLRRLSYKKLTQPVAEFWKDFDARESRRGDGYEVTLRKRAPGAKDRVRRGVVLIRSRHRGA